MEDNLELTPDEAKIVTHLLGILALREDMNLPQMLQKVGAIAILGHDGTKALIEKLNKVC